jgi:hypothetical protein
MPRITLTLDIDATALYVQRLFLAYLERFDVDPYPIGGLLELTDAIADELSENGNDRALLNGSSGEDELGERLIADLQQAVLRAATGVKQ